MNIMAIMNMAMLYFKLNSGQSAQAQVVFQEGIDVITTVAEAMNNGREESTY